MKQKILILIICFFVVLPVTRSSSPSQIGTITGDDVNLRTGADASSKIVSILKRGLAVVILQMTDSWYLVQLQNGIQGWVFNRYITTNFNSSGTPQDRFPVRIPEILDYAKAFLGTIYIYGGDSPRGFDCSGFVMYVYNQFGITLPHQANLQKEYGETVETVSELIPGDLVFFKTEGSLIVNHVGIYLGNGEFIHASSGRGYVTISPLDSGYYNEHYSEARRILNDLD